MNADFWAEAYRIFSEALDRPESTRHAFTAAASAGRPDVLREVEALLQAHDASGDFLSVPLEPNRAAPPPAPPAVGPGAHVGRWRLVSLIGEGGMGRVYRAERTDGGFAQQAAVKLTRVSLLHRDQARRFRAERAILAALQHPHIVSLLDGGSLPTGEAWLAMEFVDGLPITRHVEEFRRPLAARLRLFRDICAAVHHAHQHGVVHRDLKAQNVLVTNDGVVKVVDFGLAKLLETPASGDTTATGAAPAPMTPNTASPEQWRGLPVTTATDIYSLAVLLYELVTGTKPYDVTGKPLDEALAIATERTPTRPSTVAATHVSADGRSWPRGSDLDAVVLKGLDKDPARRYESAAAFATDVERYLDGRPVIAREASFWYIAGRTARRHAVAATAATIAVVATLTGLSVAIWQARVADRERQRAEARLAEVRQLANALVFKVHDAVAPLSGSTPVRQTIVTEALGYLERLSEEPGDDPILRLELAAAYTRIGRVQGDPQQPNLGNREGAMASLTRALEMVGPLQQHADARVRGSALAASADAHAALQNIYNGLGRMDEARAAARAGVTAMETAVQVLPDNLDVQRRLGAAYFAHALAMQRSPEAVEAWKKTGAVYEAILAEQPADPGRLRDVAMAAKYLASELEIVGRTDEAAAENQRALDLDERRLALSPDDRSAQFDVSVDLVSIAAGHTRDQHPERALPLLERALTLRRQLAATDPIDTFMPGRVGSVEWRLAENAVAAGDLAAARGWSERAVTTMSRIRAGSKDVVVLRDYAAAYTMLAVSLAGRAQAQARCNAARTAGAAVAEIRALGSDPFWTALLEVLPGLLTACERP